ncbi:MAG: hypothetical protein SRB2_03815 [Desulfobacteraceae bacterium Eth-SRB2]|nr:MAG: hypothetical protein SRB2_03815 [Desulfobacteraceae bacterium Eth-SRB2]
MQRFAKFFPFCLDRKIHQNVGKCLASVSFDDKQPYTQACYVPYRQVLETAPPVGSTSLSFCPLKRIYQKRIKSRLCGSASELHIVPLQATFCGFQLALQYLRRSLMKDCGGYIPIGRYAFTCFSFAVWIVIAKQCFSLKQDNSFHLTGYRLWDRYQTVFYVPAFFNMIVASAVCDNVAFCPEWFGYSHAASGKKHDCGIHHHIV